MCVCVCVSVCLCVCVRTHTCWSVRWGITGAERACAHAPRARAQTDIQDRQTHAAIQVLGVIGKLLASHPRSATMQSPRLH